MGVNYLGDNGPDGMCLGTGTTEKIAFFGSTPSAQASISALATGATIATVVTTVQAILAELQSKGLVG